MPAHNKDVEFARKRMNALANELMRADGLDPVRDQKRRPGYVEKAREKMRVDDAANRT